MKFPLYTLILFLFLASGCRKKEGGLPAGFPLESLQEGDLVFRRGTGLVSRAVVAADKAGSYSHTGIVVKENNRWKVVHAVPGEPDGEENPDRIKMEELDLFFHKKRATTGAVMRLSISPTLCRRAACAAIRLYRAGILFDHQYNLNDTSRMYCTELIDFVYRRQGIDLPEGRISRISVPGMSGNYLFPSDIQQNALLYLIYYF
jgi:hypothetical protein